MPRDESTGGRPHLPLFLTREVAIIGNFLYLEKVEQGGNPRAATISWEGDSWNILKMPNTSKPNKPGHITTGDILEDLGFSAQETLEAKVKADLWRDLLVHIERRGVDQAYLKKTLKIHQPDVSNLLRGKISKFSTGKLIQFAVRLNLDVRVELKEAATQNRVAAIISGAKSRKRNRESDVNRPPVSTACRLDC